MLLIKTEKMSNGNTIFTINEGGEEWHCLSTPYGGLWSGVDFTQQILGTCQFDPSSNAIREMASFLLNRYGSDAAEKYRDDMRAEGKRCSKTAAYEWYLMQKRHG